MRYWLLAGVSTLSAFAIFALIGSLLSHAAVRVALPEQAAGARARTLFRLRMLPGICAAMGAFVVALPIYLWFEEPGTTERVNVTLALVASAGAALMGRSLWRAAVAWRATARVIGEWQRHGRPVGGLNAPMPVLAVDDFSPLVAVAGVLRPRLFVAERVLRECTESQVAAMVRHECAHVSARDNVKRLLIRACPDLFGAPVALERAWAAAAEEAADAAAARLSAAVRLDLAEALIRVARLAPPRTPPLASAFYPGGSIEARVRRLVDPAPESRPARWPGLLAAGLFAVLAVAIVCAAPTLHGLMEASVRLLP